MLFSDNREQLRRFFVESWRKRREGTPLEPLEALISDIVLEHPEYHRLLEDEDALDRDWTPEEGESNPFLHMAMHISIREQIAAERPIGIGSVMQRLEQRTGNRHEAEHLAAEALAELLWEAQRSGQPPDEQVYLERLTLYASTRRR